MSSSDSSDSSDDSKKLNKKPLKNIAKNKKNDDIIIKKMTKDNVYATEQKAVCYNKKHEKNILAMGAINKITGEYVYPKIANKNDKYACQDCGKDVIFVNGKIKIKHFRHHTNTNSCDYYEKPNESQIHKDAKLLMKKILEDKNKIIFKRKCCECNDIECMNIDIMSKTSLIELEYKFIYNGKKIADVAYISNGKIMYIFEICNTHKTNEKDRPEPWFEIDASTFINYINSTDKTYEMLCVRHKRCMKCYLDYLKDINLEKYIRIKLGQQTCNNDICECNYASKCSFYKKPDDESYNKSHMRLDHDARDGYTDNIEIAKLFENDNDQIKIIVGSRKGDIFSAIVYSHDYEKYKEKYWKCWYLDQFIESNLPYIYAVDGTSLGTVVILKTMLDLKLNLINFNNSIKKYDGEKYCIYDIQNVIIYKSNNKHGQINIFLNVPYAEKDEIKKYGGKYDGTIKKWFISKNSDNIKTVLSKWKEYKCE